MTGRVAIVSLRFNPAFPAYMIAYAKAVSALGMEPGLILDPAYRSFTDLQAAATVMGWREAIRAGGWTHAVLFNLAAENREATLGLRSGGAKVYYIYHEPWQMSLAYLRMEGLRDTIKAALAHRMTVPVLKAANTVVLESQYGLSLYRRADAKHNPNAVCFPQIYDDDAEGSVAGLLSQKKYFGFIGNLCRAHGFDQYIAAMRDALVAGRDLRFLIASRRPLPDSVAKDPVFRANADRIEIRCGRTLSNEEINRCFAESFCVWNVYRRSTQSGVLPKACMFGAPVIASRIGSFPEFVQDGVNGRFTEGDDIRGTLDAVETIRGALGAYVANCRRFFLENLFYRARLDGLRQLLDMS